MDTALTARPFRTDVVLSARGARRLTALIGSIPNLTAEGVVQRGRRIHATVVVTGTAQAIDRTCALLDELFGL